MATTAVGKDQFVVAGFFVTWEDEMRREKSQVLAVAICFQGSLCVCDGGCKQCP